MLACEIKGADLKNVLEERKLVAATMAMKPSTGTDCFVML